MVRRLISKLKPEGIVGVGCLYEVKEGLSRKPAISKILVDYFKSKNNLEGYLYIGYPILFAGEDSIIVDALWISKKYGILIFDLIENSSECDNHIERQDIIYSKLDSQLRAHPELKRGRREFLVNMEVVSFASNLCHTDFDDFIISSIDDLDDTGNLTILGDFISTGGSVSEKRCQIQKAPRPG